MGRDAIEAGADETYVISTDQRDPGTAAKLVNVLRRGGIEVDRATVAFTLDGSSYPAGSFVVSGAQSFRPHLTDLLNPQVYPDRLLYPGGPPDQPYDITGWTLPYQMDVRVDKHSGLGDRRAALKLEPVEWATPPTGSVSGEATGAYAIDTRTNDAFTAVNRLLAAGDTISRTSNDVSIGGAAWPAGTFLVAAGQGTHARIERAATDLGLSIEALDQLPSGDTLRIREPRTALYQAWGGNMDEGWTRWILEQFNFAYTTLRDREIRAGDLHERFDVIILPDATYESMLRGLASDTMPDEYTGGMTIAGVASLYEFVVHGGTLVALDTAAELPLAAFNIPIRDVTEGQSDSEFYIPGTLLRLQVDNTHPVAFGMPVEATAFFARSPAFTVGRPPSRTERAMGITHEGPDTIETVATYPSSDLLKSGWLMGESVIAGRAAVLDAAVGEGRVILLGFRTQHRAQPHGTFKLLFNSILLSASE